MVLPSLTATPLFAAACVDPNHTALKHIAAGQNFLQQLLPVWSFSH